MNNREELKSTDYIAEEPGIERQLCEYFDVAWFNDTSAPYVTKTIREFAKFVAADRQALLSRIEANAPKDLEPDNYDDGFAEGLNDANKRWRTAIQKERECNE